MSKVELQNHSFNQVIKERGLVAKQSIQKGEIILIIDGRKTQTPSKYSVQIEENLHIDLPKNSTSESYLWAFLNHSCNPNTFIKQRKLIALKNISPTEKITFNYNSTEYNMATPFICHCGNNNCAKEIKGYTHLSTEEKESIKEMTAPYLIKDLELSLKG